MNQQRPSTSTLNQFQPGSNVPPSGGVHLPAANGNLPPALPPRPPTNNYQPYNNYRPNYLGGYNGMNGYNNWAYNRLGSYGGYNSYPYNSNYGNFGGPSGDVENRFIQYAEQNTRAAFQSIESFVQTFSSITTMLESTYLAMVNSFRAILNVAENVGRAKNMFSQLLSTFALIRFIKWLYKRITYNLGLSSSDPDAERLWKQTLLETANGERSGPTSWPIFIFIGLLVAIPYLIHKLTQNINQMRQNVNDPKEWLKLNETIYTATASFNFNATTPEEMNLKAGQKIFLAPHSLQPKNSNGWSRATDGINVGLVPFNYISIVGQLKKKTDINHSLDQSAQKNIQDVFNDTFNQINPPESYNSSPDEAK